MIGLLKNPRYGLAAVVSFGVAAPGCRAPGKPTEGSFERGLVWVFPGAEGGPRDMYAALNAFREAGVEAAFAVYDWSRPFGIVHNLVGETRNRAEASRIAGDVAAYRDDYPDRPVDLVGYSGGGAMAVWVAESLPEDVCVRHLVLVQPGLSPDYDLRRALAHVDGRLVHFHCSLDWFVLGLYTSVMGTMDRRHGASAGWLGFDMEEAVADPALREKVLQQPWVLDMIADGHIGIHANMLGHTWNERWVAPWLAGTVGR